MIILGINSYHADAAACLLRDGESVAAAEEERFRRIKHWAGFPTMAIAYCLAEAKILLRDVDHVAINRNNRSNLIRKLSYILTSCPNPSLIVERVRHRKKAFSIQEELVSVFGGDRFEGSVEHVEHHLAHLASAFYVSDFPEAVTASVDGFGDFASAGWGYGSAAGSNGRKGLISALARHLLSGYDAISWFSTLW